ncbi:MAG: hypothetical protein HZA14_03930 [Nitrospirae bacterium]|nr:hypothetical protein [Nitrospirota bacterium]
MLQVRESQIEDVLCHHLDITRQIIKASEDMMLIRRQKILPSGNRLDMLFIDKNQLNLIELKIESFKQIFLSQVISYRTELKKLQDNNELFDAPIRAILLCLDFAKHEIEECERENVDPIPYSPRDILEMFYQRSGIVTYGAQIKPVNHGLWRLGLLHRLLYRLDKQPLKAERLSDIAGLSKSSVKSYLSIAEDLNLVYTEMNSYNLTKIGKAYNEYKDKYMEDNLSNEQAKLLQQVVLKDPFSSPTIFGIYSLMEAVFVLARNKYPIHFSYLPEIFALFSGREKEWAKKAKTDACKMFLSYAIQIGFLSSFANEILLTPDGEKALLYLQMRRSSEMIFSKGVV